MNTENTPPSTGLTSMEFGFAPIDPDATVSGADILARSAQNSLKGKDEQNLINQINSLLPYFPETYRTDIINNPDLLRDIFEMLAVNTEQVTKLTQLLDTFTMSESRELLDALMGTSLYHLFSTALSVTQQTHTFLGGPIGLSVGKLVDGKGQYLQRILGTFEHKEGTYYDGVAHQATQVKYQKKFREELPSQNLSARVAAVVQIIVGIWEEQYLLQENMITSFAKTSELYDKLEPVDIADRTTIALLAAELQLTTLLIPIALILADSTGITSLYSESSPSLANPELNRLKFKIQDLFAQANETVKGLRSDFNGLVPLVFTDPSVTPDMHEEWFGFHENVQKALPTTSSADIAYFDPIEYFSPQALENLDLDSLIETIEDYMRYFPAGSLQLSKVKRGLLQLKELITNLDTLVHQQKLTANLDELVKSLNNEFRVLTGNPTNLIPTPEVIRRQLRGTLAASGILTS